MIKRTLSTLSLSILLSAMSGCGPADQATEESDAPVSAARAALSNNGQTVQGLGSTMFISNPARHVVYRQTSLSEPLVIIAGANNQPGYVDGAAASSRLNTPNGLAYDAAQNVLYVADVGNRVVRKIVLGGNRTVSTAVTSAQAAAAAQAAGFAGVTTMGVRGVGVGTGSRLYMTDAINHVIWMKPGANAVRLHAGSPGQPGNADGTGTAARFYNPDLVSVNTNGTIVSISEPDRCRVRLIESGGQVSTIGVSGC